ncbi:MAG: hypothetical protein AAF555_05425 [Verrucomicrobiota bacterium]
MNFRSLKNLSSVMAVSLWLLSIGALAQESAELPRPKIPLISELPDKYQCAVLVTYRGERRPSQSNSLDRILYVRDGSQILSRKMYGSGAVQEFWAFENAEIRVIESNDFRRAAFFRAVGSSSLRPFEVVKDITLDDYVSVDRVEGRLVFLFERDPADDPLADLSKEDLRLMERYIKELMLDAKESGESMTREEAEADYIAGLDLRPSRLVLDAQTQLPLQFTIGITSYTFKYAKLDKPLSAPADVVEKYQAWKASQG